MRKTITSIIFLAAAANAFAATIDGPDKVAHCSGLVRLVAEPSKGGVTAWLVFPASLDHHVDGNLLLFAAPLQPQEINFAVIEVTQEPFAILTTQHTVVVTGDSPDDPDQPPPPPPPPPVDLNKAVAKLLSEVPTDYIQFAQPVATNFSSAAATATADTIDKAQDVLQKLNRDTLPYGPTRDAWNEFFVELNTYLAKQGEPKDIASYRELLRAISAAIESSKPAVKQPAAAKAASPAL